MSLASSAGLPLDMPVETPFMASIWKCQRTYVPHYKNIKVGAVERYFDTNIKTNRIPLRDLPIRYLVFNGNNLIVTGHGVYVFSDKTGKFFYVGKAGKETNNDKPKGRSFVERIPSHFDPRTDAWMNSLLQHMADENKHYEDYGELAISAFNEFFLTLININNINDIKYCTGLESLLRRVLKPVNIVKSGVTKKEMDLTVEKYLEKYYNRHIKKPN